MTVTKGICCDAFEDYGVLYEDEPCKKIMERLVCE